MVVCGGVWWFAVVCGGLRWFVVVCGDLRVVCLLVIPFHFALLSFRQIRIHQGAPLETWSLSYWQNSGT